MFSHHFTQQSYLNCEAYQFETFSSCLKCLIKILFFFFNLLHYIKHRYVKQVRLLSPLFQNFFLMCEPYRKTIRTISFMPFNHSNSLKCLNKEYSKKSFSCFPTFRYYLTYMRSTHKTHETLNHFLLTKCTCVQIIRIFFSRSKYNSTSFLASQIVKLNYYLII